MTTRTTPRTTRRASTHASTHASTRAVTRAPARAGGRQRASPTRPRALIATAALLLAVPACSSSTAPSGSDVQSVVITPDSIGLTIGDSNTLHAVAQDGSSKAVSGQTFFWSTSDSLIATVSQSGVVTAHQSGAAQIGASAQGKTGVAKVVVGAALVHSVTIAPANDTIFASSPSNAVTLSATAFDAHGNVLPGRPVTWATGSNLVTVANALVTATDAGAGTAVVTATSSDPGAPSGSATIVVIGHVVTVTVSPGNSLLSPPGGIFPSTVQLSADLVDTFGTDVSGQRTVTWSSDNAAVASINATTGLVTAVSSSQTAVTLTATTSDGVAGTASVTVAP
jgi:hypothetical protein